MKLLMAILAILSLTACTTPAERRAQEAARQRQAQALQEFHATLHECSKQPITRKNAIQQEVCIDNAWEKLGNETNSPLMSIIYKRSASRHAITVNYTNGKISKEDWKTQLKSIQAQFEQDKDQTFAQIRQERRQQEALEQQRQQQQNLQTMQMLQVYQAMQPQYIPTPQTNIQCMRGVPGMVNCSTY